MDLTQPSTLLMQDQWVGSSYNHLDRALFRCVLESGTQTSLDFSVSLFA